MRNGNELLMRDVAQIHAFVQEFANQAVGVFAETSPPRAESIAEKDGLMQAFA